MLWCVRHPDFRTSEGESESYQAKIFGALYDKVILTKPVKVGMRQYCKVV